MLASLQTPTLKLRLSSSGAWRRRAPPPVTAVDITSSCLSPISELSSSFDSGVSSASPEPSSRAPFHYGRSSGRRPRLYSFPPIVEDFHQEDFEQIIG